MENGSWFEEGEDEPLLASDEILQRAEVEVDLAKKKQELPPAKLEKTVVKQTNLSLFAMTSEDERHVPDEAKESIRHLIDLLNQNLIEVHKTQPNSFTLPDGLIDDSTHRVLRLSDVFKDSTYVNVAEELKLAAVDPLGEGLRKLSPEQLKEIRRKAEFSNPSVTYPEQTHVWRVSRLLQKGEERIKEQRDSWLAVAANQLFQVPKRIFSKSPISITHGIETIFREIRKVPNMIFGFSYYTPTYNSYQISQKEEKAKSKYLLENITVKGMNSKQISDFLLLLREKKIKEMGQYFRPEIARELLQFVWVLDSEKPMEFDLRLYDPNLIEKINGVLLQIIKEIDAAEKNLRNKVIMEIIGETTNYQEQLQKLSKEDKIELKHKILNKLELEKQSMFFERVLESEALKKLSIKNTSEKPPAAAEYPKTELGKLIVEQIKATRIIKEEWTLYSSNRQAKYDEIKKQIVASHSILSQLDEWRESKISEQLAPWEKENTKKTNEKILKRLEENGFIQHAYFFRRYHEFNTLHAPELRRKLSSKKHPHQFSYRVEYWSSKNWKVNNAPTPPSIETSYVLSTSTAWPFWRLSNIAIRSHVWGSNLVFACSKSLVLNTKRLLYINPFYPRKKYDIENQKFVTDFSRPMQTFCSQVSRICGHITKSRRDFESTKDYGLLGKSVSRFFNVLWNYGFKGCVVLPFFTISFPAILLLAILLNFLIIVTSPITIPAISILRYFIDLLVFDFDGYKCGVISKRLGCLFPVFKFLLRTGILGIGQIILSLAGVLLHPLLAGVISSTAYLSSSLQTLYDALFYHLIIKRLARVPAMDSFVARRVKGPGLSSNFFYNIDYQLVLLSLKSQIEKYGLQFYKKKMQQEISRPREQAQLFFSRIMYPFFKGAPPFTQKAWSSVRKREDACKLALENLIKSWERSQTIKTDLSANIRGRIKMPRDDLEITLEKGQHLVETYYKNYLFSILPSEEIWEYHGIEENDWKELTQKLLSEVFGYEILTPYEETDKSLYLKVDHVSLNVANQLLSSKVLKDDLTSVTPIFDRLRDIRIESSVPSINVADASPQQTTLQLDVTSVLETELKALKEHIDEETRKASWKLLSSYQITHVPVYD